MSQIISTDPAEETRTRYVVSYAFDVSKYADFAVHAENAEDAERIAAALLKADILPALLDSEAREYDNGTDNMRVFCDGAEDEEETYETLPEIAKANGVKLPAGWETPGPQEPEKPDLLTVALDALNALQANPNDPRAHRQALDALKLAGRIS